MEGITRPTPEHIKLIQNSYLTQWCKKRVLEGISPPTLLSIYIFFLNVMMEEHFTPLSKG